MKNIIVALVLVAGLSAISRAEMTGAGHAGLMDKEKPRELINCPPPAQTGGVPETEQNGTGICKPVMQQGTGPGFLQELMEAMRDMITIQEKLLRGAGEGEKKALLKELARMRQKMERMMAGYAAVIAPALKGPAAGAE